MAALEPPIRLRLLPEGILVFAAMTLFGRAGSNVGCLRRPLFQRDLEDAAGATPVWPIPAATRVRFAAVAAQRNTHWGTWFPTRASKSYQRCKKNLPSPVWRGEISLELS